MTRNDPRQPKPRSPAEAEFVREFQSAYRVLWLIAASTVRNRSLADDMVQDAAVIAMEKFAQFQKGTSFAAWMGRIVRNVSLNAARKEGRRRAMSIGDEAVAEPPVKQRRAEASPVNERGRLVFDQTQFDDEMVRALNEVGDDARACLLLKIVEGLEYSEISRILNIPEGTAMSHVHRARKIMTERLAVDGSTRTRTGGRRR